MFSAIDPDLKISVNRERYSIIISLPNEASTQELISESLEENALFKF